MIHSLFGKKLGKRAGFTLIELAIVLAVTSLLTAGLWRMMASGNTQLRDQSSADQHKELINSIRGYLASDNGRAALIASLVDGSTFNVNLADANVIPFLPTNFTAASTNSYGQSYIVQVRRAVNGGALSSYSFMVMTTDGDDIPDTSGGRISSMIGNDGGFNYGTAVCGPLGVTACGAFGTWTVTPIAGFYGFVAGDVAAGHVASRTFVGMNAELNTPWLARLPMPLPESTADGIGDLNTIETTIAVGNNEIRGIAATGGQTGSTLTTFAQITGERLTNLGDPALHVTTPLTGAGGVGKISATDGNFDFGAVFDTDVSIAGMLVAKSLYAAGFIYDSLSDQRLKRDVKLIDNPLEKLSKFNGYSFIYNSGHETRYGVIAQEVEKSFPSLIHEGADGYKGVDYIGLIGPLVGAVNQLREENKELKAILEAQGRTMEALEKKINKKK